MVAALSVVSVRGRVPGEYREKLGSPGGAGVGLTSDSQQLGLAPVLVILWHSGGQHLSSDPHPLLRGPPDLSWMSGPQGPFPNDLLKHVL